MTPERYRQIGELYHAALEIDADELAAFLDAACAGDAEMRREVESLISSHNKAADFISSPALEVAAEMLAASEADAMTGRMIARYRVLSLVGTGGMGRVYLAEDMELGRRIALKLLPEYRTNDKSQVQRFRQEARAASALNHPNILTVYEVGQVDGTEFIATEYIEGETLRARLTGVPRDLRKSLNIAAVPRDLRKSLDIAAQIADALAAAHATGIVHRDIKPENVMLRRDGYVKVLDFGLAKLTENLAEPGTADPEAPIRRTIDTNPGVVMGTAEYMSPEQARGLAVDARTDAWSLGVMLYEMVTGQRPFGGATHSDTIVSILERDPAPLARLTPEAPAELERIVTKALMKNAEERYQAVADMAIDLRRLQRRLEGDTGVSRAMFSVEHLFSNIKRNKKHVALVGALIAIVLAGLGYGLYRFIGWKTHEVKSSNRFEKVSLTKFTTSGKAVKAAISLDGNFIAHVLTQDGRQSLWIRQLSAANSLQIVPPAEVDYTGLVFSPDGSYVYFVRWAKNDKTLVGLYQVPVLGGGERALKKEVGSPVAPSPDGKHLAFAYYLEPEAELVVTNIDGSGRRILATRLRPSSIFQPAWSPDGEKIACPVLTMRPAEEGGAFMTVVGFRINDGAEETITPQNWARIEKVIWLSSGGFIMIARETVSGPLQVWHLSYPSGNARKVTNDLNNYIDVSVSAAGDRIIAVRSDLSSNIWIAQQGDAARARQVTSGNYDGYEGLTLTPDGKVVYPTVLNGNQNLWVMEADGTNPKQLTTGGSQDFFPSASRDGRYIVFVSLRAGIRNVWRIDADGNNPKRLTSGDTLWPQCSPDGKWVLYVFFGSGKATLWKVPIDGGDPVQVLDKDLRAPSISPDGKQIAYITPERQIEVVSFEGLQILKTFQVPLATSLRLAWMPGGKAIAYIDTLDGVSNIWSQALDGGKPIRLTNFKTDRILSFALSRDGKQLILSRGSANSDVVLISDIK